MTRAEAVQCYRNAGQEIPTDLLDEASEPRKEKWGRIKKEVDGIMFDSTLEADAYVIVKMWERIGEIEDLVLQPVFVLQEKFVTASAETPRKTHRAVKYIADFSFIQSERRVIVDAKGVKTQAFIIKEKMFRVKFPHLDLQIWDKAKVKELSRC